MKIASRLRSLKAALVPALFTERQYAVLVKRAEGKGLTQVERNYLSKAIKGKVAAIEALQGLALEEARRPPDAKRLAARILASYAAAGITLHGAKPGKAFPPTETAIAVLTHHDQLDARIVDLLPVYLAKREVDLYKVFAAAVRAGVVNLAGYLFDVRDRFVPSRSIKRFLASLEKEKAPRYARSPELAKLSPPDDLARRWNLQTLNTLDTYRRSFALYGAA